jgi:hypothetical protein
LDRELQQRASDFHLLSVREENRAANLIQRRGGMNNGKLAKASESELAAKIREAIGADPDEEIDVTTPQFTRTPEQPIPAGPPSTPEEWEALKTMPQIALKEMGLGNWDGRLMMFPGEWYRHIPAGFIIEDIFGTAEEFKPGITDDDIRMGFLPYGIAAIDGKVAPECEE